MYTGYLLTRNDDSETTIGMSRGETIAEKKSHEKKNGKIVNTFCIYG